MKVVSPMHRPLLPSRKYFWYSFLLDPVNEVDEKLQMTPPGIEPATYRLLALCLNQLRHYIVLYIPRYTSIAYIRQFYLPSFTCAMSYRNREFRMLKFFALTRGIMPYEALDMWGQDISKGMIWFRYLDSTCIYSHAPHNDVSVNDGPHI